MKKQSFEALSYEEQRELAKSLIKYHGIFYKFWDLVKPSYTNSKQYPTACVVFNKDHDCVDFLINKTFWKKCSPALKEFIICHECLHVLLDHGKRATGLINRINPEITNACLDIPINEMLVKFFGFSKKEVDPRSRFCWTKTFFKDEDLPNDKSFEYYFNHAKKISNAPKISIVGMGSGDGEEDGLETNSHEGLASFDDKEAESKLEDLMSNLSEEEKESLRDIAERLDRANAGDNKSEKNNKIAGSNAGGLTKILGKIKSKPKKKWETVIKKWSHKMTRAEKEENHWLVKPRRNSLIESNLFVPSEIECEIKKADNDKIDVWMFLDTSGSCEGLAPRFWRAAKSLPKEKFNVYYHCFDTQVYPLNQKDVEKGKLYGFGGTAYSILENHIQKTIKKEGKKYPAAIFVITDGYGNFVKPQDERKWYWFLSDRCLAYIPKKSHTFMLSDFE